jgi:hypothetical protein
MPRWPQATFQNHIQDVISKPSLEEPKLYVEMAVLQAACMFAGGRTETTLTPIKVPGIRMWWVKGEGLYFTCKHQEGMIPSTNVKVVYFEKAK